MTGRHVLSSVAAAVLVSGCATAADPAGSSSRNLITSREMAETNAQTAYDAVRVLQPHWLGSRGATSMTDMTPTRVSIVVNGVEVGDASYLRNISVMDVSELRYYEPGVAATRFGMGHQRGVIEVVLKGGGNEEGAANETGRGNETGGR